jgi:glutamate racemase
VPLIEEGIIDNEIMDLTIKYYMDDFVKKNQLDSLILGCTHYPLIAPNISRLYPKLRLYNSSAEVISDVVDILTERDMLAEENDFPDRFYASDLSENFIRMTDTLFEGYDTKIKLKKLDE